MEVVGQRLTTSEGRRFVQGRSSYLPNLVRPDDAHVHFVRSPHAHARIVSIDCSEARAMDGVYAVITGADLPRNARVIPNAIEMDNYAAPVRPTLPSHKVCYVGEAVAAVIARTKALAQDAAAHVEVEYKELPAVVDSMDATESAATQIHANVPGNVLYRTTGGNADPDKIPSGGDLVLEQRFRTGRVTSAPLETRSCLARWDGHAGGLELFCGTQAPHLLRTALSGMLEIPESLLRLGVPDVGGGFGAKIHLYPEEVVVSVASMTLGRGVFWAQDRSEDLLTNAHCRDHIYDTKMVFDRDGKIQALRVDLITNCGAYPSYPQGAVLEPDGALKVILGPYDVPVFSFRGTAVCSNKAPSGAYRGVSQPSAVFVMERLLDLAAGHLGIDAAAIREANYINPGVAYTNAAGMAHQSLDMSAMLNKALNNIGYDALRERQRRGERIGLGLSCYTEITGLGSAAWKGRGIAAIPGYESAQLHIDPHGHLTVYSSIVSQGQGQATAYAQIAAEVLRVPPEKIQVRLGEPGTTLYGTGTFASRGALAGGGAVIQAAFRLRDKLLVWGERLLEVRQEDLKLEAEAVVVRGSPHSRISIAELARAAYGISSRADPGVTERGLSATATYDPPAVAFTYGVHAAVARVDTESGAVRIDRYVVVHDCGIEINPSIVEGQIRGGVAQGIAEALYEDLAYDRETGQPAFGSISDYGVPTAQEIPNIDVLAMSRLSDETLWGIRGVGESGTIGAPAAVANAVADCLGESGKRINTLPITPAQIVRYSSDEEWNKNGVQN